MEIKKSVEISELIKALCIVQGKIKHPKKDKENPFYKSKYSDLTQICEVTQPLLSDNGLAVSQFGDCVLITMLLHTSGQYIAGSLKLNPEKQTPQGFGSAITYARRYSLAAIIGIAPEDDDDDGEAAEDRTHKPTPTVKPTTKTDGSPFSTDEFLCVDCGKKIKEAVKSFSESKYKKSLCFDCQKTQGETK
jgi:hypothetical protein